MLSTSTALADGSRHDKSALWITASGSFRSMVTRGPAGIFLRYILILHQKIGIILGFSELTHRRWVSLFAAPIVCPPLRMCALDAKSPYSLK
ncbi:hypothetical protein Sango_1965900 [Sesamum angolense]|uniref:Uncharacterized protein n=1 Tax=Sesamum angolense TaxID=2727404 RepID=A0AAE2BNF6_9LAMI|nr:hypothetical protein Sango_1965900 [Sesamum angolense]